MKYIFQKNLKDVSNFKGFKMFKKTCLALCLALSLSFALQEGHGVQELAQETPQTFKIKFWKIPNVSNVDLLDDTKDKKVFESWSYEEKSPFKFFSSIKDPRAIDYITLSMQTECFLNKQTYSCLTRDLDGRDFIMREYPLDLGKSYIIEPKLYAFDNKFGIMVVDLSDKSFDNSPDLELKNRIDKIPNLVRYLSESAKIPLSDIVVIGNFGVSAEYLKNTFADLFDVLIDEPDMVTNQEGKIFFTNSQNVLVLKGSLFAKKGTVRNDLLKLKEFKGKKEELKYMDNNVSSFLPIEVEVEISLKHAIR